MTKLIYGVDPSKKVTSLMVRDAIIKCFTQAHKHIVDDIKKCDESMSKEELEKMKKINTEMLVKRFFDEISGDYENPTKEDLKKICDKLAEFSTCFRRPETIKKHYGEIMQLMEKIK